MSTSYYCSYCDAARGGLGGRCLVCGNNLSGPVDFDVSDNWPSAPEKPLPVLDASSQQQVDDFTRANVMFHVVKARVIGDGGQGAIYTLSNGTAYKLSADELAHLQPRWLNEDHYP